MHLKLCNIDPHNVTHSPISRNPREWMFVVQMLLLNVTFSSLISRYLSLMQTTKEVNSHPHIALCVNMWSATFLFFFLCHLLNVGACICHMSGKAKWNGSHHTIEILQCVLFHSVTCYTNSIASRIHVIIP